MTPAPDFDLMRVKRAIESLEFAVRSIVYHRAILSNHPSSSAFWTHVASQLLRSYVILWTDVLGAHGNETHWKNLVRDVDAFRRILYDQAGMTSEEFVRHWESLMDLRNKVFAHDDSWERPESVPDLEPSLRMARSLHQLLKEEALGRGADAGEVVVFKALSLERWEENLAEEAAAVIEAARSSTKGIDERY